MPSYKVSMYEIYRTTYLVEAEDPAAAVTEVVKHGGEVDAQEFIAEDRTRGVTSAQNPELTAQLRVLQDRLLVEAGGSLRRPKITICGVAHVEEIPEEDT